MNAREKVSFPWPVGWEHFSHDAEMGARGRGRTKDEAFEQAAPALTALVTEAEVAARISVQVTCRRSDPELLLVDWLDAIIFEMAVRRMIFGRFAVSIKGDELTGTMWGEPVDVERHAPVNPKARH